MDWEGKRRPSVGGLWLGRETGHNNKKTGHDGDLIGQHEKASHHAIQWSLWNFMLVGVVRRVLGAIDVEQDLGRRGIDRGEGAGRRHRRIAVDA